MKVLVISPLHQGEWATTMASDHGNTLVCTVSPEMVISKERYIKTLRPDLILISSALQGCDRNDCFGKATDILRSQGRDNRYINSHITFV